MINDKKICIYTIGHSTRPIDDFVEILKTYHIDQLVDIRAIPKSRYNPQYNNDTLSHTLRNRHIGYRNQKDLAGRRHSHKNSINTAWKNLSFRGFADYMQTDEFRQGIEKLIETAHHKTPVIMCAEAVPWRCHRLLISDALFIRNIEVQHIYSATSVKPHTLTPWAVVRGINITYPL